MLTAMGEEADRVLGPDPRADAYVVPSAKAVNTAARLKQATRDLDAFEVGHRTGRHQKRPIDGYVLEPLGPQALRDRAAPIEVYAVSARP